MGLENAEINQSPLMSHCNKKKKSIQGSIGSEEDKKKRRTTRQGGSVNKWRGISNFYNALSRA